MQDRRRHADGACGLGVGRIDPERRRQGVGHGLQDAKEHQADTDARREQHGQPSGIAVLRRGVPPAKANPAQRRQRNAEAEQDEEVRRGEIEPVERHGRPDPHAGEKRGRLLRKQQGADNEQDHQRGGYDEDRIVDIQIEDPDVVLADFVADIGDCRFGQGRLCA